MALTVRKRGKIWHARGTIRVGKDIIPIAEFSTGRDTQAGASDVADREGRRIAQEHLDGAAGRSRRLTLGACFVIYLRRPGGLQPYDIDRVAKLNDVMGHRPLSEIQDGWQAWMRIHPTAAPATVIRWRTILLAAVRAGCEANQVTPPTLPTVKQDRVVRMVYLSEGERHALLSAYPVHARRPVILLAYQGMRTQEVLRLDWRAVDLPREAIHVRSDGTKSGRGRTLPMHDKVHRLLRGMWNAAGKPDIGPVFLSSRGRPYEDTRGYGGNPMKKQHETACQAARVSGFRVHDWRHDFAARCVMSGMDLFTLMRLGGWASLKMVERYGSISAEHMRDAMRRVG